MVINVALSKWAVFESRFYADRTVKSGSDTGVIRMLDKIGLCNHLCEVARDAAHFQNFGPTLEEWRRLLVPGPATGSV
jgi:hypothetical protein